MNPLSLLIAVSMFSGAALGVLGFSFFGTIKMYNGARKYIASLQDDLSKALYISERAQADQLAAERELSTFRQQVAEWQKKPLSFTAALNEEQLQKIIDQLKGGNPTAWPSGKVQ